MEKLSIDSVIDKNMTWVDCMRLYKPNITEAEANNILWNETCYPFDAEMTLHQINKLLNSEPNPERATEDHQGTEAG